MPIESSVVPSRDQFFWPLVRLSPIPHTLSNEFTGTELCPKSIHRSDDLRRLLRMNYVPIDSNRSLVRIRTGFFVLFSVFKKRMTLEPKLKLQPGGALRP